MKTSMITCLALAASIGTAASAHAGAWTQVWGSGYYQVSADVVIAPQLYDAAGDRVDVPTIGEYTFGFYGEYGASERFTAILYLPFRRLSLEAADERPSDSTSGIADMEAGGRLQLMRTGPGALSAEIKLGLPISDDRHPRGLTTGDGEFNTKVMLQFGHSFHPAPTYLGAELGVNMRGEGFSDELVYGLEVGYRLNARWMLIGRIIGLESFENGDAGIGGTNGINS